MCPPPPIAPPSLGLSRRALILCRTTPELQGSSLDFPHYLSLRLQAFHYPKSLFYHKPNPSRHNLPWPLTPLIPIPRPSSMAPQPIHIIARGGGMSSSTGVYVAGFVVAGLVLTGAASWLAIRFLRKRAQRKDEDNRGAAFLNVRGLVREDGEKTEGDALPRYG